MGPRFCSSSDWDRVAWTTATCIPWAATTSTSQVGASPRDRHRDRGGAGVDRGLSGGLNSPAASEPTEPRCWVLPAFLYTPEPSEPPAMTRLDGELCDNILLGSQARLPTRYGNFRIHAFVCPFRGEEHVAVVKGKVAGKREVLVRLHSECVTGDVFGSE